MQIIDGIPVWGSPVDQGALRQIKNCAKTADRVALMADHHRGRLELQWRRQKNSTRTRTRKMRVFIHLIHATFLFFFKYRWDIDEEGIERCSLCGLRRA